MPCMRLPAIALLAACVLHAAPSSAEEDLAGPPAVTAQAWVVADGVTGEILAGHEADTPRKSASTTKTMCALVVLELAAREPAVLEELVTFSRLADATSGSTADIKAGEKVSVRDCLHGLMLPSGNDAGNALAEHFNARLQPPGPESPPLLREPAYKTRRNFIAEMNRHAKRLGLTKTVYRLSYGDGGTATDRTTSAADLVRLGLEAMKNPLFREIVQKQSYQGKVLLPGGKTRLAKWENTNELLKLGGYDGIKTGYTPTAGNCLLARGTHNGRALLVAVLGCSSSEGRFVDARNLCRWIWSRPR